MIEREILTTILKTLKEEYNFYEKGYGAEKPTHVEYEVNRLRESISWVEGKIVQLNDMEYPKETNYT